MDLRRVDRELGGDRLSLTGTGGDPLDGLRAAARAAWEAAGDGAADEDAVKPALASAGL
ncbi:hypothetical protein [Thermocatellispora tengchongensis]|uniref:hypothetical protein n=1 Tax=Thermocatellispora tengchongensis TaxID=1073253 RepID=UPI00362D6EF4